MVKLKDQPLSGHGAAIPKGTNGKSACSRMHLVMRSDAAVRSCGRRILDLAGAINLKIDHAMLCVKNDLSLRSCNGLVSKVIADRIAAIRCRITVVRRTPRPKEIIAVLANPVSKY